MQTFVPFPDYVESAKALDNLRLGKQRVEVYQILNVLHEINPSAGWRNHPAVKMWRGHELQLCEYGLVVCEEWISRGFKDTVTAQIRQHMEWAESGDMLKPDWWGDTRVHDSHKSNLLRKAELHYLHHSGMAHDAHGKCSGSPEQHKLHAGCKPRELLDWYEPKFPGMSPSLAYYWPV